MATEQAVTPSHRRLQPARILVCALVVLLFGAVATLFGWDVGGWLRHLWNTITSISVGYLIVALALITLQTTTTAFAWYSILRSAYPATQVVWSQILACYAAAVGLNAILPANIGTLAMLVMFTSIIAAATFAGVIAGYVVQKVFYTCIGTAVYVYLFLSVGGSFDLQFGFVGEHPWATVILFAAGGALLVLVARMLRERIADWWRQAKDGGQIAAQPKRYLSRVLLPEAISWVAMLGIIAVFLAAYDIPVTFHTVMRVVGGNSIANMTSVTPGGAGVQQGFNVISLQGVTTSANATAYSVAQQLVTTAWSLVLAIVLVVHAFGWTGGKTLVKESYGQAREKSAEQSAARKAKHEARREARREERAAHGAPVDRVDR